MAITPRQWSVYDRARANGLSIAKAADAAGFSIQSGNAREKYLRQKRAEKQAETQRAGMLNGGPPRKREELSAEALRALDDFGLFQRRYFGRIATPWQEEAAQRIVEMMATPDKEYVVINAPPGSGKSTTFVHDIPIWLTARDRSIRGQIGSRVAGQAEKYVLRIRRDFERTRPIKSDTDEIELGLAVDAVATLQDDYGRFKPERPDLWTQSAFVVAQIDDVLIDEKEPTWSGFGFDGGYLGMRYKVVFWDDVVDKASLRTVEAKEKLQEQWDDIAEKRLEPGGLLVLQGQRMGADDLYRYCLDKRELVDVWTEGEVPRARYQHIVYKAHYDELCAHKDRGLGANAGAGGGNVEFMHLPTAPPYPEGCLLDPRRLTWRDLRIEMANPRGNYQVIFQQEDINPDDVLVNPLWVTGGQDVRTGEWFPGCYDDDRRLGEIPQGLAGQLFTYATVDPSPARFWSIQLWMARCENGKPYERYLIDHFRGKLDMPGFLDVRRGTVDTYMGLADEWQKRSVRAGHPISHWIVEKNAAQRFILQTEAFRRWAANNHVVWVPHETLANPRDHEFGVRGLIPGPWREGLIRLPHSRFDNQGPGNPVARLVEEVTHYDKWPTSDCVMSHWFGEYHLPNLVPRSNPLRAFNVPANLLRNARTYVGR